MSVRRALERSSPRGRWQGSSGRKSRNSRDLTGWAIGGGHREDTSVCRNQQGGVGVGVDVGVGVGVNVDVGVGVEHALGGRERCVQSSGHYGDTSQEHALQKPAISKHSLGVVSGHLAPCGLQCAPLPHPQQLQSTKKGFFGECVCICNIFGIMSCFGPHGPSRNPAAVGRADSAKRRHICLPLKSA